MIISILLTLIKFIKKTTINNKNYARITNSAQKKLKVIYILSSNYNIIPFYFIIKFLINKIYILNEYYKGVNLLKSILRVCEPRRKLPKELSYKMPDLLIYPRPSHV